MKDIGPWVLTLLSFFSIFSCLNPIIYGFMSKSFRQSFASELRACYCCFRAMNQGLEGQLQQPLHQQENANFRPINTTTQVQNGQQQRGGHSQNLKRHLEDRCRPHTITWVSKKHILRPYTFLVIMHFCWCCVIS